MAVNGVTSTTQTGAGAETPSSAALPIDKLANKETFLQLLVAQIKNQDPLQPSDGIQFVTQLAQFSQLEQLIGIRGDLDVLNKSSTDTTDSTKLP